MKANELMVNDWVSYEGAKCRVAGFLYGKCEVTYPRIGETIYDVPLKHILPVPLTREILEKNGWKEAVLRHWNIEEDFAIEKGEDGNMFWFLRGVSLVCSLNFVHELQHALRLCGIDKEITL